MAETADIVVIGSGIGGLCCAALLARYGYEVVVCESHTIPGGAAHGFERQGYRFDSGPSLYSGLSQPSPNPLRQVLEAVGAQLDWLTYDAWGVCIPEGDFRTAVGADQFCQVLQRLRGADAVAQWRQLQQVMEPLGQAVVALPVAAIRFDWGVLGTTAPYLPNLLPHSLRLLQLSRPFSHVVASTVSDPFIRHWLDLLCFLLSGLPASGTSTAEMAFMFADWYRSGVCLDYPAGGSGALVAALVQALQRHGGRLHLGAHVAQIQGANHARGVVLRSGETIAARVAVIANASIWDTLPLLEAGAVPEAFHQRRQKTPQCRSFMHLHLGIDATGLPPDLACHYIVVNDWERGVDAEQNVVLISIPSQLDPSLAPPGRHAVHVYTPGSEPYGPWQGLDRRSQVYGQLKQQRAEVMWQALERIIPDIHQRCELALVGTPLTHERFLRRHRGTYGPAIAAGSGFFPGPRTPLPGLLCCGDSTFPGIGLPAVAASGLMAAHSLVSVSQQQDLLRHILPQFQGKR